MNTAWVTSGDPGESVLYIRALNYVISVINIFVVLNYLFSIINIIALLILILTFLLLF